MGHSPGFPCLIADLNHDGQCSTLVPHDFVNLDETRWFDVGDNVYRTNSTAAPGFQVEYRRQDGTWTPDHSYATEWVFLHDVRDSCRELTAEEVLSLG